MLEEVKEEDEELDFNLSVDEDEFKTHLELQRNRSKNVSKIIKEDWEIINNLSELLKRKKIFIKFSNDL